MHADILMIPVILSDGNLMLSCFGHDGTGIMMIHIHLSIQSGEKQAKVAGLDSLPPGLL